jgi:nucleoside-diphosphate-sugar epimerase
MSQRLTNKNIIVTAAGQGIGKATAIAFCNEGANVIATDLNKKTLLDLNKEYPKIKVFTLDSTDYNAIKAFAKTIDKVDVLFNAVGFVHHGTILDCEEKDWDFSFNVNIKSMYFMIKLIIPKMLKVNNGNIINIASVASSIKGFPFRFVYGASKAATDVYLQERMENGFIKGFITRAFSHTGPRRGKIFSISSDAYQIARMMKGLQDPVLLVGNLSTTRVVMDVRDTVRSYYLAMMNPEVTNHIFNICGDTPRKMQFFTDKLIELSGLDHVEQKIHEPFWRPHEIHYQHGDSTNLVELTGFKEEYDIDQTLNDLLQYWYDKIN